MKNLEIPLWKFLPLYVQTEKAEKAIDALEKEDVDSFESLMQEISERADENLCKKELNHAIENLYLGDEAFRELTQNAVDSYKRMGMGKEENTERGEINISYTKTSDTAYHVEFEDHAKGMDIRDVISYLLVVGSSDKLDKEDEIGKHGIGFYSTLKNSEEVIVDTNKWRVSLYKKDGEYKVNLSVLPKPRKGTKVTMHNYNSGENPVDLVEDYCGFVDPDKFAIFIKGRKINSRRDFEIFRDVKANLRGKEHNISVSAKAESSSSAVYTQEGLTIESEPNYKNLATVLVDFPASVRLSRGRRTVPEGIKRPLQKSFKKLYRDYAAYILQKSRHDDLSLAEIQYLEKHFGSREFLIRFAEGFRSAITSLRSIRKPEGPTAHEVGKALGHVTAVSGMFVGGAYGIMKLVEYLPREYYPLFLSIPGVLGALGIKAGINYVREKRREKGYGGEKLEILEVKGGEEVKFSDYLRFFGYYLKSVFSMQGLYPISLQKIIPAQKKENYTVEKVRISKREGVRYLRRKKLFFGWVGDADGYYVNERYDNLFHNEIEKMGGKDLKQKTEKVKEKREYSYSWRLKSKLTSMRQHLFDTSSGIGRGIKNMVTNSVLIPVPGSIINIAYKLGHAKDEKMLVEVGDYFARLLSKANGYEKVFVVPAYGYEKFTAATYGLGGLPFSALAINMKGKFRNIIERMKSTGVDESVAEAFLHFVAHEYSHVKDRSGWHDIHYWNKNEQIKNNTYNYILKNGIDTKKDVTQIIQKYRS